MAGRLPSPLLLLLLVLSLLQLTAALPFLREKLPLVKEAPSEVASTVVATSEEEEETALQVDGEKPTRPPRVKACWRDAKVRGPGTLPERGQCPPGKEKSAGLCYDACPQDMEGMGSVCWDACKRIKGYTEGELFFCCETKEGCDKLIKEIGVTLPTAIAKLIFDIAVNPANVAAIMKEFVQLVRSALALTLPKCAAVQQDIRDLLFAAQ